MKYILRDFQLFEPRQLHKVVDPMTVFRSAYTGEHLPHRRLQAAAVPLTASQTQVSSWSTQPARVSRPRGSAAETAAKAEGAAANVKGAQNRAMGAWAQRLKGRLQLLGVDPASAVARRQARRQQRLQSWWGEANGLGWSRDGHHKGVGLVKKQHGGHLSRGAGGQRERGRDEGASGNMGGSWGSGLSSMEWAALQGPATMRMVLSSAEAEWSPAAEAAAAGRTTVATAAAAAAEDKRGWRGFASRQVKKQQDSGVAVGGMDGGLRSGSQRKTRRQLLQKPIAPIPHLAPAAKAWHLVDPSIRAKDMWEMSSGK